MKEKDYYKKELILDKVLPYAESLGLGTREYELIDIDK